VSPLPVVRIAWATDSGYALPCAVSIHSVLRRLEGPAEIHLLGYCLDERARGLIEATVEAHRDARLIMHELTEDRLAGLDIAHHPWMTPATFGRQFLPRLIEDRVLYLDADTIAADNVRPLAEAELGGCPAGAVRDFGTLAKFERLAAPVGQRDRKARRLREQDARKLDAMRERVGFDDLRSYFNAGIMVIDCAAIRSEPELLAGFEDIESAARYKLLDQDWLNRLLQGRVAFQDPRWNAYWGNFLSKRRPFSAETRQAFAASRRAPGIVHYPGKHKPWQPFRVSQIHRGLRWFAGWRIEERHWRGSLPEAARALI